MEETYEDSEKTVMGDGCGLCDLRDLAHCALVNRQWYLIAQEVLYRSVRIDAVHFCPLEEYFSEQRRKRHIDPATIVPARLRLFQRTAWARPDIAATCLYFKIPYMTRETHKADLARTISALPNLRYVDLPEGFYSADPSTNILRDELIATCWDLRKMKFNAGAEQVFEAHAHQQLWMNLEIVELNELNVDITVLRYVLAMMPALRELSLNALPRLDDTAFHATPNLPDFASVQTLKIQSAPAITFTGIMEYLTRPTSGGSLSSLSLTHTGVQVPMLYLILDGAKHLKHFSITEEVSSNFPLDPVPPLASRSLHTLNFEITSRQDGSRPGLITPSTSYYNYLATSLHANAMPSLRKLFVRHSQFPELLAAPPPTVGPRNTLMPPAMTGSGPPSQLRRTATQRARFTQPLEIFAKGSDDLEWAFTSLGLDDDEPTGPSLSPGSNQLPALKPPSAPFANGRPGSSGASGRRGSDNLGRPVSAFMATQSNLGPQWGGEARKSVMMGNGQGGFLAVPVTDGAAAVASDESFPAPQRPWVDSGERPRSAGRSSGFVPGHKSTGSRGLWR
ncbi:MAG: hypothetical protein Q9159_007620 [Coniocarpon cinnabarinum]